MSYPGCTWPTLDEFKKIVNLDPISDEFDVTAQRQLDAAIAIVKAQVGEWDELIDCPNDQLSGAALRAAYLLSLRESPAAIVNDEVFMTYMTGQHRRFAIA
jgi:hypothetical protein